MNIAECIQRRRLQMLVHSAIYYNYNANVISDATWDRWARELVSLQKQYPDISSQVIWYDVFKDWDGTSGAFLPLTDDWVVRKARYIMEIYGIKEGVAKKVTKRKGRLF